MFFLFKIGLLFTTILAALYSIQFWPYRRSLLTRLFAVNLFIVFLWAFWVLLTLLSPDEEMKIFFTKIRQLSTPFLTPLWLTVLVLIFMRSSWPRLKKFFPLLLLWPGLTSLTTLMSLLGSHFVEKFVAHTFEPLGDTGLMKYIAGPTLKIQFLYGFVLMALMMLLIVWKLFSKDRAVRRLAWMFFLCGTLQIGFEVFAHSSYGAPVFIQAGVVLYIPLMMVVHFAIQRLEFLNIQGAANQAAFNDLPIPVITLNPRREIWDANKKALELFHLNSGDIGRSISGDPRFQFIEAREKMLVLEEVRYQVDLHRLDESIYLPGVEVISLTDVTELHRMNQELSENNLNLSTMNSEFLSLLKEALSKNQEN